MTTNEEWMLRQVDELVKRQKNLEALLMVVLARISDVTHVSVDEASRITGLPPWTVKRRYVPLETIPGTRKTGIPVERVCEGWLDLPTARAIVARIRKAEQEK